MGRVRGKSPREQGEGPSRTASARRASRARGPGTVLESRAGPSASLHLHKRRPEPGSVCLDARSPGRPHPLVSRGFLTRWRSSQPPADRARWSLGHGRGVTPRYRPSPERPSAARSPHAPVNARILCRAFPGRWNDGLRNWAASARPPGNLGGLAAVDRPAALQPRRAGDLCHVDTPHPVRIHFRRRRREKRLSGFQRYVVLSVIRIGGTAMKLLNSLKKKIFPEKSLKAYAWYIWY